ncbi:MarR family winged helix-turn-helix transcriptional regulator [Granulicella paludicola]|uniref:MarR family winged helix-turn-helix transcriptional regulator n=1 Tax=Granulicella paludicola TaxID=474951 RepID=UPI0021E042C7|nr:MarR family transcriptional regulator [Granulicella paludicola]
MKEEVSRPRLERIHLLKEILQAYRVVLEEELRPYGITATQLRMLWAVQSSPEASGAEIARECLVTPQSGQATLARLEEAGWITRRHSAKNDRVLVAEMTVKGKKILLKAREIAERLERKMWAGMSEAELSQADAVLRRALARLNEGV